MGTYTLDELWRLWQQERLPHTAATGQLIQHQLKLEKALAAANLTLYQLKAQVDSLAAAEAQPGPGRPGRRKGRG